MNDAPTPLQVLSAGAAQGLLLALLPRFEAEHGVVVSARFGAVGAMKEALLGGAPCDLFITTEALLDTLAAEGRLAGDSRTPLGLVHTGVAVRRGDAHPGVATPADLRAALLACTSLHFPDPERATAGIHCARVLKELGVADALQSRCRTHPNGATAMRALGDATDAAPLGCTQVTEILYTEGVELVAGLPPPLELATPYAAALVQGTPRAPLAAALLRLIGGDEAAALRRQGGFT